MTSFSSSSISGMLTGMASTAASVIRIMLTRRPSRCPVATAAGAPLYILGNGPSLRTNLDNDMDLLAAADTLAVNFAANTPEFFLLRPRYYVLADPHFFKNLTDPNVARLIESLNSVTWNLTLFVPAAARIPAELFHNPSLKLSRFAFNAAEGFSCFENKVFDLQLGMPRPRNVLIPSIMIGIWMGYSRIYLLGADHSWLSTLSVDDDNRVVSIQPHFYAEDAHEQQRIHTTYLDIPLHQVLESFYIAFRSYRRIAEYARRKKVEIINATPGSFIDAFPRGMLPSRL